MNVWGVGLIAVMALLVALGLVLYVIPFIRGRR